jgi:NADH-quinone oxidoreductase subunit N
MTVDSFRVLPPFIFLAIGAVAVMLLAAFRRNHRVAVLTTLASITVALLSLPIVVGASERQVTPLLIVDDFSLFYTGLILFAAFVVTVLSYAYFEPRPGRNEEFYALLLCATLGAVFMTASDHFVSFFLSLEIMSVSLYAMIAYPRVQNESIEAAVKYLVLAAGSVAFLLFGMALIYAETGTMSFAGLADAMKTPSLSASILPLCGAALMIVGMGFKLALAPFHWWTPDVYEGAPAPVTAFVATISKGAAFAVLLRFFAQFDVHAYPSIVTLFFVMAIASMFAGNLLALLQRNVKRILAYSSIAHLGYLLIAFLGNGAVAATAAAFYLLAYFLTTLTAFGVVTLMSTPTREASSIEDYRGLMQRRPWIAAIFTAALLSLAGIPLTAGFMGKLYVLAAGAQSAQWTLVILLIVNSGIGAFYYLRIIVSMSAPISREDVETGSVGPKSSAMLMATIAVSVATFALIWFGVFPYALMRLAQDFVAAPGLAP